MLQFFSTWHLTVCVMNARQNARAVQRGLHYSLISRCTILGLLNEQKNCIKSSGHFGYSPFLRAKNGVSKTKERYASHAS